MSETVSCQAKCRTDIPATESYLLFNCEQGCYWSTALKMQQQELVNVWLNAFHNHCGAVEECVGPHCLPWNKGGTWPPM